MAKRMLIDATHPEETRVVILSGSRLEEFDFETSTKKQVKGNIYLAKVTRVEPSLQAAFVEYGGNRHGFLAFSEIHPDYYRIPVADREALLAEQAADDDDEEEFESEPRRRQRRPRRGERRDGGRAAQSDGEGNGGTETVAADDAGWDRRAPADREVDDAPDHSEGDHSEGDHSEAGHSEAGHREEDEGAETVDGADTVEGDGTEGEGSGRPPPAMAAADGLRVPSLRSDRVEGHAATGDEQAAPAESGDPAVAQGATGEPDAEQPADSAAAIRQSAEAAVAEPSAEAAVTEADIEPTWEADAPGRVEPEGAERHHDDGRDDEGRGDEGRDDEGRDDEGRDPGDQDEGVSHAAPGSDDNGEGPPPTAEEEAERSEAAAAIETLGGDELEDVRRRRQRSTRQYKIQEVIKRRQIMLVQVTKEERGNKGAALTTFLSLAGRYCVLMPNAGRSGGGVSRKIVNPVDRRRLKSLIEEMQLPEGMSVIVRTAGSERSRAEIKRDLEYLLRLWDEIRELTMQSTAPALVYEEGKLIKRAIRDLYSRDIEEILVEGEDAYREAKDFMRMLMPSHAKRVQPYRDPGIPLFNRFQIDQQIDAIHSPVVQLKSGGYIVINPTEALVAIDVNSGRSTRERNIEETAYRTNLEAADEIARQLRLRDLAGLIVIDFIDMEEGRNQHAVERRLKEAMKVDRARIQIGRISPFGLLELSRQRLRPSIFETSTQPCPHCGGTGHIRSTESTALHVLRAIEEEGLRRRSAEIRVTVPTAVALYVLNQKRAALSDIERRYAFDVVIDRDDELIPPDYRLERLRVRAASEAPPLPAPLPIEPEDDDLDIEDEAAEDEAEETAADAAESGEAPAGDAGDEEDGGRRRRRRRRRRDERGPSEERGRNEERSPAEDVGEAQDQPALAAESEPAPEADATAPATGEATSEAEDGEDDEDGEGAAEAAGDDEDQQARRRRRRGRRGGRRRTRRDDEAQGEAGAEADAEAPVAAVAAPAVAMPAVAMPLDPRAAVEALFEALEAQHEVRREAPKAPVVDRETARAPTDERSAQAEPSDEAAAEDPWRAVTATAPSDAGTSPAEPDAVPQPDAEPAAVDARTVAPDTGDTAVPAASGDDAVAQTIPGGESVEGTAPEPAESTVAVPAVTDAAPADTAARDAGPVALPLFVPAPTASAPTASAEPSADAAAEARGPVLQETPEPAPAAATSEPVVTTPAEPARPARKGWWQRLVETR